MKITVDKRLFWFCKEGAEIDLSIRPDLDMFVQQTLSRGKTSDIKSLLKLLTPQDFSASFNRINNFLPLEVKIFWEEWLGDINKPAKKDSYPV